MARHKSLNKTQMFISKKYSLLDEYVSYQACLRPDKTAIICNNKHLSYSELEYLSDQVAKYLITFSNAAEIPIALYTQRNFNMIIGVLGILKAGYAYVPIDQDYPSDRVKYILKDSGANIILTESCLANQFKENSLGIDTKLQHVLIEEAFTKKEISNDIISKRSEPDNTAYLIYTSGSTGRPKGIEVAHSSVTNIIKAMANVFSVDHTTTTLMVIPLVFDVSVSDIFLPLINGATLVIANDRENKSSKKLQELIQSHNITFMQATPATWGLLLDSDWHGCKKLTALTGGEAISLQMSNKLARKVGNLWNVYGPAEATVWATYSKLSKHDSVVKIGKPFANVQVYILNEDYKPVQNNKVGELYIAGSGLAKGYLNRKQLTQDKFITLHNLTEYPLRLYRTGDRARFNEQGELVFIGRCDNQVKVRGFRIEPGEIESELLKNIAIKQCAVVAKPVITELNDLIAYIVPFDNSQKIHFSDISEFLAKSLPKYMLPNFIVQLDEIPLTINGKLDKDSLPLPKLEQIDDSVELIKPKNILEDKMTQIWKQAFKFQYQSISTKHNFFELGGHSLLAISICNMIESEVHVAIDIQTFYQNPTIEKLVHYINTNKETLGQKSIFSLETSTESGLFPLTQEQRGIWKTAFMHSDNPCYNISSILHISGKLNIDCLQKSLQHIIQRHSILRTILVLDGDKPKQKIIPSRDLGFTLKVNESEDLLANYENILQEDSRQIFELFDKPLFKIKLYKKADNYLLLLCFHHLIIDGLSLDRLYNELAILYQEINAGLDQPLPELMYQYRDYAICQTQVNNTLSKESQIEYWKSQLEKYVPLNFPTDKCRPAKLNFSEKYYDYDIPLELYQKLNNFVHSTSSSIYLILLTVFDILLSRYCVQEDIVIGCPSSVHSNACTEKIFGPIGNLLVLRSDLSKNPRFIDLLADNKKILYAALSNHDLEFENLIELSNIQIDTSIHPLVQILLIELPDRFGEFNIPNLNIECQTLHQGSGIFDLALYFFKTKSSIKLRMGYQSELYKLETIETLMSHFVNLLSNSIRLPDSSICDLSLFAVSDPKSNVNCKVNTTEIENTIHQHFTAQAMFSPERLAVICGDVKLTYAELEIKSNQMANYLLQHDVETEDLIGIHMQRNAELIICILAILKAKCAYVPIDSEYPPERIKQIIQHSRCRILIITADLKSKLSDVLIEVEHKMHLIVLEQHLKNITDQPSKMLNTILNNNETNLAYIIYTSGTTGKPKGIALQHYTITNLVTWQIKDSINKPVDRVTQFASFSFDVSLQEIFYALLNGLELHIIPNKLKYTLPLFLEYISEYKINQIFLPTSILEYFSKEALIGCYDLTDLQEIIVAGEKLSITDNIKQFFIANEHIYLTNQYGPSESHVVSAYTLPNNRSLWGDSPSIGTAIDNVRLYVLDKNLQVVPDGIAGELYIGGKVLAREYLHQQQITEEKFIANPFIQNEKIYKSGDIVKRNADGNIQFVGRADGQIKIRGFRVEPSEVEAVILRKKEIKNCVISLDEKISDQLVAHIEPFDIQSFSDSSESICSYLRKHLPSYMVPNKVHFVDRIPLTQNGKIDKKKLKYFTSTQQKSEIEFIAPRNKTEQELASIITKILKLDNICIFKNIFELGANSLTIMQILLEIKKHFLIQLEPSNIFENVTVGELSSVIRCRENV